METEKGSARMRTKKRERKGRNYKSSARMQPPEARPEVWPAWPSVVSVGKENPEESSLGVFEHPLATSRAPCCK